MKIKNQSHKKVCHKNLNLNIKNIVQKLLNLRKKNKQTNKQLQNNKVVVDSLGKNGKDFIKKQQILKSQQGFRGKKHNVFTEEIKKIVLSANNDKRIQSIDSIKTCTWNK